MNYSAQKLTDREKEILAEGKRLFDLFKGQNKAYKQEVAVARKIAQLKDPDQEDIPQLHTLRSTLVSAVADQMDNIPEARIYPERPDTQEKAEQLTDIVQYVFGINDFPRLNRERIEDNFIAGTSALQYVWDPDANAGKGDIAIIVCPIESIEWDYASRELQQSRAVFRKSWYPRSYFDQHYPDKADYIRSAVYFRSDVEGVGPQTSVADEDDEILLLEYWYRVFDAEKRRYVIHVAYIAGDCLLYSSEKAHPEGIYQHGRYPFVFDVYTRVYNQMHGNGMVMELAPMQRAINRYAQYIDDNARINSRNRILYDDASGINEDDLKNLTKQLVKGDNISDNHIRWFPESRLSPSVQANMYGFIDMMKQDSGQTQFNRGETAGGVTAMGAIQSLQEAGNKTSRFRTEVFKYGTKEGVEQILWLVKQFYKNDKIITIVGDNGKIKDIHTKDLFGGEEIMPYAVRIQIQRNNPLRVQAENDLIMQLFNAAAQQNQALDIGLMIRLLQVDGKDRFLKAIEEEKGDRVAALQQENAGLQQQVMLAKQMLAEDAAGLAETGAEAQPFLQE